MRTLPKKTVATATATVVILLGAGVAFAYWTGTGSGVGDAATAAEGGAVTIVQTSPITDLRPGGAAQPLYGNFNNDNADPVYITAVTATVAGNSLEGAGCSSADYSITGSAPVNADVAPGPGQGSWGYGAAGGDLTIALTNTAENQDACKGATVYLAFTAN